LPDQPGQRPSAKHRSWSTAVVSVLIVALFALAPRTASARDPEPVVAELLSLTATLVPIAVAAGLLATGEGGRENIRFSLSMALLGAGAVFGPSIGKFYAKDPGEATLTILLRGVTTSVLLAGVGVKTRKPDQETLGTALIVAGGVPTGLVALYDFWTAPKRARDASRRRRTVADLEMNGPPLPLPGGTGLYQSSVSLLGPELLRPVEHGPHLVDGLGTGL
jgi:hypothetical protein